MQNKEEITKLLIDIDIDINIEDVETIDEIDDLVMECIAQENVIYYARAMEYLTENDTSLTESLELADNMGYEAKDLNSELLATLLLQQNMNEDYQKIRSEIEDLLS